MASLEGWWHLSPRVLALAVMLALLVVAVPFTAMITARRLARAQAAGTSKLARYARIIIVLWSMTALALYALHLYGQGPADVGVRPPTSPAGYLLGLLVPLVLATLGSGRRDPAPNYARRVGVVIPASPAEWIGFCLLAASAGICEEFLYRGFALTKIAALTGSLPAGVALSSAAFGLAHWYQGKMGIVGVTIAGLCFALVFIATGSILPCMIGHFIQDLVGAALLVRRIARLSSAAPNESG